MAMKRRPLVAANWKMNGLLADGTALARGVRAEVEKMATGAEVLVCPPATLIQAVGAVLKGGPVALGGQDCHAKKDGAYTGDIAAAMLADLGCSYVIVGHSERRSYHHESDNDVAAKAAAALAAGLKVIVCVGETEAQRDSGEALAIVAGQILGSVPDGTNAGNLVIAYEPVWAIGTGRTPTTPDIAEMHAMIRRNLAERLADGADVRVLYGGSVKPSNAAEVLALEDVDGALVGGASLKIEDFIAIVAAAPV
ncbi:MAG TPA: triose-phosphate isomerase [Stellaceae bacterium]|jgi:triosephosphate isomerase|nr:triose-phosphate isomerase [Stellaceae bacterium]